jgi:hypothetical protein
LDQLKRIGAVAVCMLLLVGAFFIYAKNWDDQPAQDRNMDTFIFGENHAVREPDQTGPDWLYTEETRRGAYFTMQQAAERQLRQDGAGEVLWRSNVHHVEGDTFVFVGFVEAGSLGGGNVRMAYKATVRALSSGSFEVVSFSAKPADEAMEDLGNSWPG